MAQKTMWFGSGKKVHDVKKAVVTSSGGSGNRIFYIHNLTIMDKTNTQPDHKNSAGNADNSRRRTHRHGWILAAVVVLTFTVVCVIGFSKTNLTHDQVSLIFSIWEKIIRLTF